MKGNRAAYQPDNNPRGSCFGYESDTLMLTGSSTKGQVSLLHGEGEVWRMHSGRHLGGGGGRVGTGCGWVAVERICREQGDEDPAAKAKQMRWREDGVGYGLPL